MKDQTEVGNPFGRGHVPDRYPNHYSPAFAFSAILYPQQMRGSLHRRLSRLAARHRYGLTLFRAVSTSQEGLAFLPVTVLSACLHQAGRQPVTYRFGSSLSVDLARSSLTAFISDSQMLALWPSLAPHPDFDFQNHAANLTAAAHPEVLPVQAAGVHPELGGDHDLVAHGLQRFANHFLVLVWAVDLGGVKEGDAALKMAGTILLNATRSTDVIGRLGGDEFCVVAFSRSPNDAEIEALRLHAQLTEALSKFTPVGASIGVAFFDEAELSATEMIQKADEIMYSVKKAGKGSVLVKVV